MPRVKICGITRCEDARLVADAGADAIGINLIAGPRRVDIATARGILEALPPMCTPVALVDVSSGGVPSEYLELLGRYWVSHVQVYNADAPDTIARLQCDGFTTIVARHVIPDRFPSDIATWLKSLSAPPDAILLDAHQEGALGGTGTRVDWQHLSDARDAGAFKDWPPIMLAGGLNPDNVAQAIDVVKPWAVDVSSGVEAIVGQKDPDKVHRFIAQARGTQS